MDLDPDPQRSQCGSTTLFLGVIVLPQMRVPVQKKCVLKLWMQCAIYLLAEKKSSRGASERIQSTEITTEFQLNYDRISTEIMTELQLKLR
jgi:hypothetical protein